MPTDAEQRAAVKICMAISEPPAVSCFNLFLRLQPSRVRFSPPRSL